MKIKKQFIPLIESGEKKYEFRNSGDNFYKHYTINGCVYYLSLFDTAVWSGSKLICDIPMGEVKERYYLETHSYHIYEVSKQEYDWLKENWDCYFLSTIYIGQWEKIGTIDDIPKLEIIDNE